MAKRVFEIAKELTVQSKAIVEKCQAEEIPGIKNHMSSVSAGLEATIKEWFKDAGEDIAEESSANVGTAVETAPKVDLKKVRAKKRTAKKAARKKAEPAAESPPAAPPTTTEATPAAPAPDEQPDQPSDTGEQQPPQKAATADQPAAPDQPDTDTDGPADAETETPAADKPDAGAPTTPPTANVPERPDDVTPRGKRIETVKKTPAKLSGPKVVRVEAPDQIDTPRRRSDRGGGMPSSRGPRSGGGAGFIQDVPDMPSPGSDRGRGKRRGGGGQGDDSSGGPARRRGGKGAPSSGGNWRYQDLVEREERLSRSEGFLRQRRRDQKQRGGPAKRAETAAQTGGSVKIQAPFTIKDLSAATGVKGSEIVKKLFLEGIITTINAPIDPEKAQELMLEWNIELEIQAQARGQAAVIEEFEAREEGEIQPRRPVATILGHVDHGKTSLLDRIRNAKVAAGEAGGITQATSAFVVPVRSGDTDETQEVCFLDTPGHEAFTEMRSRGATMTDIVVLVVAADDGVMPQTIESISHAKAAGVPIIVALNKIDIPGVDNESNIQKIYGQLAEHELNPTAWGGETEVIKVSAETGQGIPELLETLSLTAEILELTADYVGTATGVVIESQMVEGRGATANVLVQQGMLEVGNFIVAGRGFGRVRDLTDDTGSRVLEVLPSTPVQLSGIDVLPDPGDKFYVVKSLKLAEQAASQRREEERQRQLAQPKMTLDSMFAQMGEAEKAELLIVLKADVQGSIDAIRKSIEEISTDEVTVRVLHAAVGGITESDVSLAAASGAIVFGFNVIPSAKARQAAEQKGVELRAYRVIYDIVDDCKKAAAGLLSPEVREEILGHAEVRQVFKVSGVGAIAGCYVTDGLIERNAFIRVTRDDIVIEQDRLLEQLKRFKDDVKEVRNGNECGMKIARYDDIKEGDILECFRKTEVAREL